MSSRPELGTKRTDPETGRKFYDLGKDPIISPYTGTSYPLSFFDAPSSGPSRRSAALDYPVRVDETAEPAADEQDDDADTVSLSDVEDDEAGEAKSTAIDVDDDEADPEDDDSENKFLALDEADGDDNVDDLVGERDEDEG